MLAAMDRRAAVHLVDGRVEVVPGTRGGIPFRAPEVVARAVRAMSSAAASSTPLPTR